MISKMNSMKTSIVETLKVETPIVDTLKVETLIVENAEEKQEEEESELVPNIDTLSLGSNHNTENEKSDNEDLDCNDDR